LNTTLAVANRLESLQDFLSYRASVAYANEEMQLEEFGFGRYERKGFIYPEQLDHWWDEYPYLLVDLSQYRVMSEQHEVFSKTVEHYLMTPLQASDRGNTRRDGIVPHALLSQATSTIYLSEGNHRCAAARISHRPLLMKLAPITKVKPVS
jgi:hypothetical protein